jgi:hypothetical protein
MLIMDTRYNVYFAGGLIEGHDQATVRERMGRLFKANEATLDKLFSGKSQLVKKDCDRATALKYKQAMEQAGAQPVIRASGAGAAEPQQASKKLTAAERIAMLAAEADAGHEPAPVTTQASPVRDVPAENDQALKLLPEGTEVLRPEERKPPARSTVQELDLELDLQGERLSAVPPPPPPVPDTSHLTAAPAGEALPTLSRQAKPVSPDISALELAPEGTDFSDCKAPDIAAPALDLGGIDLAPEGSDVLEQKYRRRHDEPAPSTDHLSLDD